MFHGEERGGVVCGREGGLRSESGMGSARACGGGPQSGRGWGVLTWESDIAIIGGEHDDQSTQPNLGPTERQIAQSTL